MLRYGTAAEWMPLRTAPDVEAIIGGLADGTLDAIATDHAPHALNSNEAAGGCALQRHRPGDRFGIAMTCLVDSGRMSLSDVILLSTSNPAGIIRNPGGHIQVGVPADLTLVDPEREWTYSVAAGKSKSRNSPFEGWKLKGVVAATIVGGRLVYRGI